MLQCKLTYLCWLSVADALLQCFPYGQRGENVGFPRARFIGHILMSLGVADWFDMAGIVLRAWGEVFCESMRLNETLFRPFAKTLLFCSQAGGLGVVRGDQHGARQPGLIRPIWLSSVAQGLLFLSQQKTSQAQTWSHSRRNLWRPLQIKSVCLSRRDVW